MEHCAHAVYDLCFKNIPYMKQEGDFALQPQSSDLPGEEGLSRVFGGTNFVSVREEHYLLDWVVFYLCANICLNTED